MNTIKRNITIGIYLFVWFSVAQVGIGTSLPNDSAQLDVVSSNKGTLITRVALTSSTDTTTIINGNVESLLVYNTETALDITPGYYYWDGVRWVRLLSSTSITDTNTTNVSLTQDGTNLILTDSDGNTIQLPLTDIQGTDTNTTNAFLTQDGTNLILTDSDGNTVQIPLTDIQGTDTNTSNVSLTQDGTNLILTDSDGNTVQIPLVDIQAGADTNTTNVSLTQDGTNLILTDSDGNTVQLPLTDIQGTDTNTTNVSLTQDGTNLILIDSDGNTIQIPLTDIQGTDTNTTNVSLTQDGTNLILTDSDGNMVQVALADIQGSYVEPWLSQNGTQLDISDDTVATTNTENIYQMGNVGVGTPYVVGKFHVNSEDSQDVMFSRTLDGAGNLNNDMDIDIVRTYGTTLMPTPITLDGTHIGGLRFRGLVNSDLAAPPLTALPIMAQIIVVADGVPSPTSAPGKMIFYTTPSGSVSDIPRMVIDNQGNVGIGEDNPGEKLVVNGTIKATQINFTGLPTYADDAAAGAGGLVAGDCYKTATGELRIKL